MPPILESTRGNQDAFDRLLNWIGSLKVQGQNVAAFERDVLELERIVQSFDNESLTKMVNQKLDVWLSLNVLPGKVKLTIGGQQSLTVKQFHEKILAIIDLLKIFKDFPHLLPEHLSLIDVIALGQERTKISLLGSPSEGKTTFRISNLPHLPHSLEHKTDALEETLLENLEAIPEIPIQGSSNIDLYGTTKTSWINRGEFKDYQYQWEIFIKFSGDHHRAAKVSKLLWLLSEALESVSGVAVEIEDQGTGSIWFKLRVFILNLIAKDEVRDLLEKSRDAVLAEQVGKRIEGTEKLREEKLKIQAERSLLERQTELTPDSEEAKKIRELELKRKELEIREKEADVKRKELENYKATLDLAQQWSYLMKEGVFAAAPVEIKINGETYLSCQDGKFLGGATMEVIDQVGAAKPVEDESP